MFIRTAAHAVVPGMELDSSRPPQRTFQVFRLRHASVLGTTKTVVVVRVRRIVVVADRHAHVLRVVVPIAAAQNPIAVVLFLPHIFRSIHGLIFLSARNICPTSRGPARLTMIEQVRILVLSA